MNNSVKMHIGKVFTAYGNALEMNDRIIRF